MLLHNRSEGKISIIKCGAGKDHILKKRKKEKNNNIAY